MGLSAPPAYVTDKNNPREVRGWMIYDWAHSAFTTTVIAALFGPYLTTITEAAVGENGVIASLGSWYTITGKSFYGDCVSLSVLLQVFLLPLLGSVADYTHFKRRFLMLFCLIGALATCGFFFLTADTYLLGGLLFVIANLSFGASAVFYNAFLNEITTEDQRDKVSSRGFALGYFGGGLLLAINLAMVTLMEDTGLAVRLSLLSSGLWWGGFGLWGISRIRLRKPEFTLEKGRSLVTVGFVELWRTFKELRRLPETFKYLVAYLFYNDGIQTVISMASVFLAYELFTSKGLPDSDAQSFLLGLVLMIQFVGVIGALGFERVARWLGTKWAIMASLVLWMGVILYAYGPLATVTEAWVLGAVIALILGGSQALSRSLFSRMIPKGREASFYGLYEISERGTSWIGPFIFARVVAETGSYRNAILSLIALFGIGIVMLLITNTTRAIHESGNLLPEEAATLTGEQQP